jgi:hypothetical protein
VPDGSLELSRTALIGEIVIPNRLQPERKSAPCRVPSKSRFLAMLEMTSEQSYFGTLRMAIFPAHCRCALHPK